MRLKKYKIQMGRMLDKKKRSHERKQASQEDRTAWEALVTSRKPTNFTDLPLVAQSVFSAAALIIRAAQPAVILSVIGSFAKGTYLLDTDTAETARLRTANLYKVGASDYDILIEGVASLQDSDFTGLPSTVHIHSLDDGSTKIAIP